LHADFGQRAPRARAAGIHVARREFMANTSAGDASSAVPMFGDVFTDINAHYILGRKLGTGNFAKVVQATCRHDLPQCRLKAGQHVAVKVVKKPQSRSVERLHMIRAEVEILRSVQHANIVRLFEIFESDAKIFLVMEELTGGELFDRLVTLGKYTEEDARYFTFKLLNAVLYLHDREICHRDLKPENILLASKVPSPSRRRMGARARAGVRVRVSQP